MHRRPRKASSSLSSVQNTPHSSSLLTFLVTASEVRSSSGATRAAPSKNPLMPLPSPPFRSRHEKCAAAQAQPRAACGPFISITSSFSNCPHASSLPTFSVAASGVRSSSGATQGSMRPTPTSSRSTSRRDLPRSDSCKDNKCLLLLASAECVCV